MKGCICHFSTLSYPNYCRFIGELEPTHSIFQSACENQWGNAWTRRLSWKGSGGIKAGNGKTKDSAQPLEMSCDIQAEARNGQVPSTTTQPCSARKTHYFRQVPERVSGWALPRLQGQCPLGWRTVQMIKINKSTPLRCKGRSRWYVKKLCSGNRREKVFSSCIQSCRQNSSRFLYTYIDRCEKNCSPCKTHGPVLLDT